MAKEITDPLLAGRLGAVARCRQEEFKTRQLIEDEVRRKVVEGVSIAHSKTVEAVLDAKSHGATMAQIMRAYGTKDYRTISNLLNEVSYVPEVDDKVSSLTWNEDGSVTFRSFEYGGKIYGETEPLRFTNWGGGFGWMPDDNWMEPTSEWYDWVENVGLHKAAKDAIKNGN